MTKNIIILFSFLFSSIVSQAESNPIDRYLVSDQEAILLFRYVAGAGVPVLQDTQNEILHAEVMMCSIYFNAGVGPKQIRCLLPNEQVTIDRDNAAEITEILKKYNMPSDHKFGYETVQAGLDCTKDVSGDKFPICYLSARTMQLKYFQMIP